MAQQRTSKGKTSPLLSNNDITFLQIVLSQPYRNYNMGRPSILSLQFYRGESNKHSPSETSLANEPLPSPMVNVLLEAWDSHEWNHSSSAITNWLNARWAKTGYQVSEETVYFTLRASGRDARMGLGDSLEGAFCRE